MNEKSVNEMQKSEGKDWYDNAERHPFYFGYFIFAWLPKRCRNGKVRWLAWLEKHSDGSYTAGDRAP